MSNPKEPQKGDMHIDATAVATVQLTPEYIKTLTKLRPGYENAIANLKRLTPTQVKVTGATQEEITEIVELAAEHKQIASLYEASAHMTEVLRSTYFERGHQIATRLGETVEQAKRRAERSPNGAEILGPLEDLLEYQLGPALKGVATRKAKKAPPSKGDEAPKDAGEAAP